jgi:hypothetical protein
MRDRLFAKHSIDHTLRPRAARSHWRIPGFTTFKTERFSPDVWRREQLAAPDIPLSDSPSIRQSTATQ